jgi:endogenous inhibitor of DNA gyrase (YacG/DUF329 family)
MTNPELSEPTIQEETVVCPDCGFMWDNGQFKRIALEGGDLNAWLTEQRNAPGNEELQGNDV